jgi:hypothetical protein
MIDELKDLIDLAYKANPNEANYLVDKLIKSLHTESNHLLTARHNLRQRLSVRGLDQSCLLNDITQPLIDQKRKEISSLEMKRSSINRGGK